MSAFKSVRLNVLFLSCLFSVSSFVHAGAHIFASEANGVDYIAHPQNYTGNGGELIVRLCIDPNSQNATEMVYSVQNIVATYNQLVATDDNLKRGVNNNIPTNTFDFESVALHEAGHCLGLAHPNASSESGLTGNDRNYTKSTNGANGYDLDAGADGIIGSSDDMRGDDVNLVWFRTLNNDPFTIDSVIDSTTYSRDLADLPAGHFYAANADRAVSTLLNHPSTEAVMQQGTFGDEAQRTLGHDDVATLRYAASGLDERESGGPANKNEDDNYTIKLVYGGISDTNCDFSMSITTTSGFAFCSVDGTIIDTNHARVNNASIQFGGSFNWFFNAYDSDDDGLSDDDEVNVYSTLPHNDDSDGDGLSDYDEVILYGTDPNDTDSDGDFINDFDEIDYGSNPLDDASWPNFADGDVSPLGAPDGLTNASDYLIAQRIALGDVNATSLELSHSDLYPPDSPDGVINTSDLILLLKLVQQ